MAQPTVVLVHCAFHSVEHFGPLQTHLESHGYNCVAVSLPSTQSTDLAPARLEDDTAAVRIAVTAALDEGNDVVVVAHSYGGCPTNNALQGLDTASRSAAGASTSVSAIAFLCALPQPAGVVMADSVDPVNGIHDCSGDFCTVKPNPGPTHYFYNDFDDAEANRWSETLRPMSRLAFEGKTTYAAYMDIPSSYLMCTKDNALPLPAQQGMVQAAVACGAKIRVESVEAGHSPFLSKLEQTSAFIRRAAGELGA